MKDIGKRIKTLTHVGSDVPREEALPLLLARIMTRIKVDPVTACWTWQENLTTLGYAHAMLQGRRRVLHRFMYEALAGKPPEAGMDICHSCHNRACINPWHIRQDTHAANLAESSEAKRLNGQYKTHCKRGHPLTENNMLRGKLRLCAICSRGRYRVRLGWPEDMAFSDFLVPDGYMLDRETKQIVPIRPRKVEAVTE